MNYAISITIRCVLSFIGLVWCEASFAQGATAPSSTTHRLTTGKLASDATRRDEAAARIEVNLPAQLPTLTGQYQISSDLPGYVDVWRSVSFVEAELDVDSIPWAFDTLEDFVEYWTAQTFYEWAVKEEGLKPLGRNWVSTAQGYAAVHMRYDYASEGVDWRRHEWVVLDPETQDEEGNPRYHLVSVVSHYPQHVADEVEQEVLEALNQIILNP